MKQLFLFVFIDALGWEVVQERPFLEGIARGRGPLRTILGYSSAALPSILSGRLPVSHGHWSCFHYSPETSPFRCLRPLRLLPASVVDRGRARRHLSRLVRRWLGYTGYFQLYAVPLRYVHLFDYVEKRDLFRPGGLNHGPSIFDLLEERGLPSHVSDWRRSDSANLEAARRALGDGAIRFAFVYCAELDGLMHRVGTRSPLVDEKLRWYDVEIRKLVEAGSRTADVHLCVFSDHGMADVHTAYDLMGRVQALDLVYGKDYAAVYDSTMARFWFLGGKAEKRIRGLLDTVPVGRVLPEPELVDLGVHWPDARFGQLIFLVDPGVLIVPSFMSAKPVAAMHGYHPDDPSSDAAFWSSWLPDPRPAAITDLFAVMRAALESGEREGEG